MKYKLVHDLYFDIFGDQQMIDHIVDIVNGIKTSVFPDDSPMGLYTVGEVRQTEGFYASLPMIEELIGAMTGRSIRGFCMQMSIPLEHPFVMKLMVDTTKQQQRIAQKTLNKLITKYGPPARIDVDKIEDLTTRAHRFIINKHH